jgi:hypothetical protein
MPTSIWPTVSTLYVASDGSLMAASELAIE